MLCLYMKLYTFMTAVLTAINVGYCSLTIVLFSSGSKVYTISFRLCNFVLKEPTRAHPIAKSTALPTPYFTWLELLQKVCDFKIV